MKTLKDRTFKYPNIHHNEIGSSINSDLHVELIFLYHKVSVRLLDKKQTSKQSNETGNENGNEILNFIFIFYFKSKILETLNLEIILGSYSDNNFEALLRNCKRNKVSQSLLYLAKSLSLVNSIDSKKISSEKKNFIEVINNNNLSKNTIHILNL